MDDNPDRVDETELDTLPILPVIDPDTTDLVVEIDETGRTDDTGATEELDKVWELLKDDFVVEIVVRTELVLVLLGGTTTVEDFDVVEVDILEVVVCGGVLVVIGGGA